MNNNKKYIDTSVYSLDSNSIFSVALGFERLAIQELNRNPEVFYLGNNISTYEKDGYEFKISMDKLISLVKEFYVKIVTRNQGISDFTYNELNDYLDSIVSEKMENIAPQSSDSKRFVKLMDKMNNEALTLEGLNARKEAIQVEIENIKKNKSKKGPIDNLVRIMLIVENAMKRFKEIRNEYYGVLDEDDEQVYNPDNDPEFTAPPINTSQSSALTGDNSSLYTTPVKLSDNEEEEEEEEEDDDEEDDEEEEFYEAEDIDIDTLLSEIENDILNKKDPVIIGAKIKKLQEDLKEIIVLDGRIKMEIINFEKISRSKTFSTSWKKKVKTKIKEFKSLISKASPVSDAQSKDSKQYKLGKNPFGLQAMGAEEVKGLPDDADEVDDAVEDEKLVGSALLRGGVVTVEEDDLKFIDEYESYKFDLYQESLNVLKQKPIISKAEAIYRSTKLSTYEGTASNVLREIMITTGSMTSNISKNRINLNQGISIDSKLVESIQKDNDVIMNRFIPVLIESDEIERYYKEPFDKVLNNLSYIDGFVGEL